MNVVGITVCVGYSKLLEITLAKSSECLQHVYVVTKPTDDETIKLCEPYENVTVLKHDFKVDHKWIDTWTRRYHSGQAAQLPSSKEQWFIDKVNQKAFNKGAGLRLGQQEAEKNFPTSFYLVLDCDIVLTSKLTEVVENTALETDVLYGIRQRRDYISLTDYNKQTNYHVYGGSIGGWGYFQLYKTTEIIHYDDWHTAAATDKWFKEDVIKRDYKNMRILETHVDHLGQEGASQFLKKYKFDFK